MRTNNLLMRKPKGGFPGVAAVLLSFSIALAGIAAGGIVLAGCGSPVSTGPDYGQRRSGRLLRGGGRVRGDASQFGCGHEPDSGKGRREVHPSPPLSRVARINL